MAQTTFLAQRAKARQVVLACCAPNMLAMACRSVLAKAIQIPRTFSHLAVRVYVQKKTFWNATSPKIVEKMTLRHLLQIKLMQKLALLAFFAQIT